MSEHVLVHYSNSDQMSLRIFSLSFIKFSLFFILGNETVFFLKTTMVHIKSYKFLMLTVNESKTTFNKSWKIYNQHKKKSE